MTTSEEFSIVQQFENNLNKLRPIRANNDSTYQDINDYVLLNNSNFTQSTVQGDRKDTYIFDSTAVQSNENLSAVLHSGLTDPSTRWFNLRPRDERIADDEQLKIWLKQVHDIMFSVFTRSGSGFSQQNHEYFLSLGGYGTSVMWVADEPGTGITFQTRHLSEVYIEENSKGFVDTVYRTFKFNARQAAQEFGEESLGPKLQMALKQDPHMEFEFLHVVLPKKDFARIAGEGQIPSNSLNKDYMSIHLCLEDKNILKVGGFHEMPYLVARWEKMAGEVYGRSPAWNSLSDILMVNIMQETVIKAAQKQIDPPLLMSDDGVVLPLQTFPGGVNIGAITDEGRALIQPLTTGARPDIGLDMIERVRDSIKKAFFIDQFSDDSLRGRDRVTAQEITQRQENRLRLIGPQVRRIEDEYLSPLINRVFGILNRRGLLPPIPQSIASQGLTAIDLDIEYVSPLAFTQRANQLVAYNRFFANLSGFVQVSPDIGPELTKRFNIDEVVRESAEAAGIPITQMKTREQVAEEDQATQQAIQEQVQTEQLLAGVDAAATLQKSGIPIVPGA